MADYVEKLAVKLDSQWVSDENREKAFAAVRECEAAGEDPVATFGTPSDYAETFPRDEEKRRQFQLPMHIGGVLAVLWFVGGIIYLKTASSHPPVDFVLLGGPIAILCLSMVAAQVISSFRGRRSLR